MEKKYLDKIEFFDILNQLQNFAVTYIGKEQVLSLMPFDNIDNVKTNLSQTTEAYLYTYKKGNIPMFPICNVTLHLKQLKTGMTLSPKFLLDIANILKLSRELKSYFSLYENEIKIDFTKHLDKLFSAIYSNKGIEQQIFSSILDENTIDDHASDNLYSIRKKQKRMEQLIRDKLNSYLTSKYVQEPIITIRSERFVIPVKQEYRGEVKGFVHDISASGATVFIEPMSVFDLNNELNKLKLEENIEIEKILSNLSISCQGIAVQLEENLSLIGKLDFIFAKAKYAIHLHATEPIIVEDKYIELLEARHPLIYTEKVVPISIHLGKDFSTLVITGPNTGGKTVTLKTVGLLTAMAMSGLYIPAKEHSKVTVFDSIFADIGDQQSIAESLSTFSSHITNIIDILNKATNKSLILFDELGGGTDPIEGAALAISILSHLHSLGCLTIATTHYSEIKNYALVTEGFENASSDFNTETLKPTYRLLIGVPGKSNAFAISRTLGLKQEILDVAEKLIDDSTIRSEELLKEIYNDKLKVEQEKEIIEKNLAEIEHLKQSLKKDNSLLEEQSDSILSNAKLQARNILLQAKEEADLSIKELKHASDSQNIYGIRQNLNDKIKEIKFDQKQTSSTLSHGDIQIGMPVFVTTLKQDGIVLSLPNKNNEVQVQAGSLKLNIKLTQLTKSNIKKQNNKITIKQSQSSLKGATIQNEINVIGYTVDEATFAIDKYLDNCSLSSLSTIRIIHGKGTGALKNGIHQFLKKHPHVKSYRIGTFGEGEMGVTVVEIK